MSLNANFPNILPNFEHNRPFKPPLLRPKLYKTSVRMSPTYVNHIHRTPLTMKHKAIPFEGFLQLEYFSPVLAVDLPSEARDDGDGGGGDGNGEEKEMVMGVDGGGWE